MDEYKTICCPKCGSEVIHYDEKAIFNPTANCRKCRKRIIYHIDSGEVEMKSIPLRNCSSGMTFY